MKVKMECGGQFFSRKSWKKGRRYRKLRFGRGFAIGPVLFLKRK